MFIQKPVSAFDLVELSVISSVPKDAITKPTRILQAERWLVIFTLNRDPAIGVRPISEDIKVTHVVKAFILEAAHEVDAFS
ncbi:hypothetical protein PCA_01065 [Rhodanobacter sp. PCA2]|nr:hypothetical protein [Rhodanobacter sp. PCA2]